MLYPGTAEPVRLQATLHAGPYLRAMSAHSGWAYYLTGAAVEKVYELDAGNQAGGIQVRLDPPLHRRLQPFAASDMDSKWRYQQPSHLLHATPCACQLVRTLQAALPKLLLHVSHAT